MESTDLLFKTVSKMKESQDKKKDIVEYIQEHKPYLLSSTFKSTRIRECCNELTFHDYLYGKPKLYRANFCKYDKFCLACSTRKSIRMIKRLMEWIEQKHLYNKHRYHITLTVRHCRWESLKKVLDKLCNAKGKLGKRYRNWKRINQKSKSFLNYFDGIISSIEVRYNESNGRHPYIHMLAYWEIELPIEYLEEWQCYWNKELQDERLEITGDSNQISMREITVEEGNIDKSWISEVFKYAVKFSALDVPHLVELIELQSSRKYHFLSTYWEFRWWRLDEKIPNEEKDFVEKTLVYFEDDYKDLEVENPIKKEALKVTSIDDVIGDMDEILW